MIKRPLILAFLLTGCGGVDEFDAELDAEILAEPVEPVDAADELAAPAAPAVPIALVVGDCPGAQRLIGTLDAGVGSCDLGGTTPSQWSATALFSAGSPGVANLIESVPAELERYCAYDYVGAGEVSSTDYSALINAADAYTELDATTLAADCRGEFEQGDLYDPAVGAGLRDAFLANIGWDMSGQLSLDGDRRFAEVAVIDTVSQAVADDPNLDPANEHGLQMGALVREIHCPDGAAGCGDEVRHILAMPRDDWTVAPDWTLGGRHGSQGDLALGVYQAVQSWRERRIADANNSAPRLVINLSIGWTRLSGEPLEGTVGPSAAVLAAMRYASCHGALMIAAAGNTPDELCPADHPGALAPAAFESLAAPTASECAALGYSPQWTQSYPIFAGAGDYAPLVHAVGGLDEFDEPLINARPGAMPRLAALGANGIVDTGSEPLSGTSVSAAVTSGTAALIWSHRPSLRPDEVMQLIYDAGWSTGETADFALGGASPGVRRLAVCAALDDACAAEGNDGAECPELSCSATAPAVDGNLGSFASAVNSVLSDPGTTVDQIQSAASEQFPTCGGGNVETTNLTSPQPDVPVCSRCALFAGDGAINDDDELSMTIDASYSGQITGLSLITLDVVGNRSYLSFGTGVIDSLNDQPTLVDVTQVLVDRPDAAEASLEFTLSDGSQQTNRIAVIE